MVLSNGTGSQILSVQSCDLSLLVLRIRLKLPTALV
jgi:hypothetical protein